MPKYSYSCSSCGEDFDVYHLMSEVADKCTICESSDIKRNVCFSFTTTAKNESGGLVKEFIEYTRREVKREKRRLKEEFHD